ncbi:MAG: helix-turn-helix transcriptional regulator [Clostridiales bacterium]|nr:helix-turn-helix transcriptional regulator [Clostridiales bacterium]
MQSKLEIGTRLRQLREALGYTHEELAEMINVSPRFCYDMELGNRGMSLNTLCSLAEALNTTCDYLLFGPEDNDSKNQHDLDMEPFIAIVEACPNIKRENLLKIMTSYLEAVREE